MNDMLKYPTILYGRESKDDKRKLPIENQQRAMRAWALADHQVEGVLDELWDDGVSGAIPLLQRPKGKKIARHMESHPETQICVACVYVDRFARDTLSGLQEARKLEEGGAKLVCTGDGWDARNSRDPTYFQLRLVLAESERRRILQRTQDGLQRLLEVEQIPPVGPLTFGYRLDSDGRLVEDPIEGPIVRRMFAMILEGAFLTDVLAWLCTLPDISPGHRYQKKGSGEIRRRANSENVRWHHSKVRKILANATYMGLYTWKGQQYPVPPLVSPETWNRVHDELQERGRALGIRPRRAPGDILGGVLSCGICHQPLYGQNHRKKVGGRVYPYRYYLCRNARRAGVGCGCKRLRQPETDRQVWALCESYLRSPGDLLRRVIEADQERGVEVAHLDQKAEELRAALSAVNDEIAGIWAMKERNGWSLSDVEPGIRSAKARQDALLADLAKVQDSLRAVNALRGEAASVAQALESIRECLNRGPLAPEEQSRIVRLLVASAEVRTKRRGRKKVAEIAIELRWGEAVSGEEGARGNLPFGAHNSPTPGHTATEGPKTLPVLLGVG